MGSMSNRSLTYIIDCDWITFQIWTHLYFVSLPAKLTESSRGNSSDRTYGTECLHQISLVHDLVKILPSLALISCSVFLSGQPGSCLRLAYTGLCQQNSCMFQFPRPLSAHWPKQPMQSPSARTEQLSPNLAGFFFARQFWFLLSKICILKLYALTFLQTPCQASKQC